MSENNEIYALAQVVCKSAGATPSKLYHVTHTKHVPKIMKKGILPVQTSNWVQGREGGDRFGGGEIYAFENPSDAVRWAFKMEWGFYTSTGKGKISIITFAPGDGKWEVDTNDPLGQASASGRWLKSYGRVPPENILSATPVTSDMTKKLVSGEDITL